MTLYVAPSTLATGLCTPHIASAALTMSAKLMAAVATPRIKFSSFSPLRDGSQHKEEKEKAEKAHPLLGSEWSFFCRSSWSEISPMAHTIYTFSSRPPSHP